MPIAELRAITELLKRRTGDSRVVIDALYVLKGFRRGPNHSRPRNYACWSAFWRAMSDDVGEVELLWCKSHQGEAELVRLGSPAIFYVANSVADKLVDDRAAAHQLPGFLVAHVLAQ